MKTQAISSFFVLFAIVAGIAAAPAAFAEVTVSAPAGTSVPGCEDTNECFIPADISVDVGETVIWSNDDTAAHTVTSGSAADGPDGVFDSSLFMAATTFEHTFDEAGDYPYFCMVHPWMVGTVTVGAAGEEMEEEMMEEEEVMEPAGEETAEGMLSDGTEVEIWTSAPTAGERMEITVAFDESEHVNYDILVTQNGESVLEETLTHHHNGVGSHMTAPLDSADPVDITITFQGYGIKPPQFTGPIGEQVVFTNVVPEFGTIAALILVVAIVSIIAVTAKSKLSLMPRI